YGMAERQIIDIASRLKDNEPLDNLNDIRGTCVARKDLGFLEDPAEIPSFDEVASDKHKFLDAFKTYSKELNPFSAKAVVQKIDARYCVQLPPALPLTTDEMDRIYGLKFIRKCHPRYEKAQGVPALKTVETSITSHRGCAASCSFCSLSLHQGRVIQSRSPESIEKEADDIAGQKGFKGTISDVGGPTANMYAAVCKAENICSRADCLWPEICPNFKIDFSKQSKVLKNVSRLKGVKKVNIQSGLRFDLLLLPEAREYFLDLCRYYISGQLKVAPEHVSGKVLKLMHKPPFKTYEKFVKEYEELNKKLGKKQYLVQYFITSHPGCDLSDALMLSRYTRSMGYMPEQLQDFIPLPMTRSGVMFYTGIDPDTGEKLYVAKNKSDRKKQRKLIQGRESIDDELT
ncbi:MAG TPA: YgiQ family radical SAM protein, partial [Candidatus Omnitrophota bacterium]|nr:YgiQ family radical SAM protein [Candidatus Omnitrophota bacterium]